VTGTTGSTGGRPQAALPESPRPSVVRMTGIDKRFPGVHALHGVSFEVGDAEVHGLVGENGAGKSTLVKILAGAQVPDEGTVEVQGQQLGLGNPLSAQHAGIAAIYQEPNIVAAMSAVENVFLGQEPRRFGIVSRRAMLARFDELRGQLGVEVPASGPAGRLPIGMQQAIEIMRALARGARVVIMDEPTAALPAAERVALHRTVEILRAGGASVIWISHDLDEVLAVCSRVTVMQDGRVVRTADSATTSKQALIEAMLGDRYHDGIGATAGRRRSSAELRPLVEVRGLNVPGRIRDLDLTVSAGEIVGIAGLVGSGRTRLLRALAGAEPTATGQLTIEGRSVRWPSSPPAALKLGISLAPQDRRAEGLVLGLQAQENVMLSTLGSSGYLGLLSKGRLKRSAQQTAAEVDLPDHRLPVPASNLSGGNQQKVVLGKCLRRRPRLLLVDEPTRGIDIGGKTEVFQLLRRLAEDGMGVIMVSEEIEEVAELSDRVIVVSQGAVTAELSGDDISLEAVLSKMFPNGATGSGL
jgi:ABC-type sugar transport system ATPase subunit